ncbi:transforming growth factor beta activator LRRC32-like [Pseudophryne corroboree]|uniref:transforming growth factor beta activator LRRC32-like n=1 Tax=Pseudophryne corroboree TaxID=495146 RepID=UPI0030821C20
MDSSLDDSSISNSSKSKLHLYRYPALAKSEESSRELSIARDKIAAFEAKFKSTLIANTKNNWLEKLEGQVTTYRRELIQFKRQKLAKVNADYEQNRSVFEMKCQNLSLHTLPRSLSNNIKTLDLSHNLITKLTNRSMSHFYNLVNLNLYYNQLETIENGALDALSHLQSLNLESNRLYKQNSSHKGVLDHLQRLKTLNLANNNLDSDMMHCYLSSATSLLNLDLSRNAIIILFSEMFAGVPRLSTLDLSDNYIEEIERGTFNSLKDLRVLNLALNAMHCIASFDLLQLRLLNLSSNSLEFFIGQNSQESYQLSNLDLSQNNLQHFPILPKFHMLQHLNLSGNNIGELIPSSYETEHSLGATTWHEATAELELPAAIENIISHLTHLINLDLSNNHLVTFPWYFLSYLSTLQKLNMAENCLHNVTDGFSIKISDKMKNRKNMSLRVLDLRANSIQSIPYWLFDMLPGIEQINLKNNNIKFCSCCHNGQNNSASSVDVCSNFSDAHNLHYLNLQNNSIQDIPPHVFHHKSLFSLDLSHNAGLNIQAGALKEVEQSLQTLSLNRNWMNDTQANLPCLKWLKSLDLSNNRLQVFPPSLLCSSLESLDLQNNSLRSIDERATLIWTNSLKNISISGNSFDCCSLNWVHSLLIAETNILDLDKAYCIYPSSNTRVPFIKQSNHAQHCHHKTGVGYLKFVIMVLVSVTLCSIFVMIPRSS